MAGRATWKRPEHSVVGSGVTVACHRASRRPDPLVRPGTTSCAILPYSAGAGRARAVQMVSLPATGWRGTRNASTSEADAMAAPIWKTNAGSFIQRRPNTTGMKTAAMWLMVKATLAVGAMSAGSAIFWK